jgi:hypothetical protein
MAFDERNKDKIVLSEKEFKCCLGVVDAVKESALAMSLLKSDLREVATEFIYNDFGLNFQCKSKFDVVDLTNNIIVDVKTTESANPKQFKYDYFRYGYDIQAAFYMMAYERITGITPDFFILAIEKESPYAISVIRVQKSSLSVAFEKLHQGFKLLDECMTGNRFPDYSDVIYDIDNIY